MTSVQFQFSDLDTVIAEVHPLLEAWHREAALASLEDVRLHRMKLVVHEWLANLVQHADFGGRAPRIELALVLEDDDVRCVIEDNSNGFDFGRQLAEQRAKLEAEAFAERGRGLLIMLDGTDDLRYFPLPTTAAGSDAPSEASAEPRQRLEFWISVTPTPCLDTPS